MEIVQYQQTFFFSLMKDEGLHSFNSHHISIKLTPFNHHWNNFLSFITFFFSLWLTAILISFLFLFQRFLSVQDNIWQNWLESRFFFFFLICFVRNISSTNQATETLIEKSFLELERNYFGIWCVYMENTNSNLCFVLLRFKRSTSRKEITLIHL